MRICGPQYPALKFLKAFVTTYILLLSMFLLSKDLWLEHFVCKKPWVINIFSFSLFKPGGIGERSIIIITQGNWGNDCRCASFLVLLTYIPRRWGEKWWAVWQYRSVGSQPLENWLIPARAGGGELAAECWSLSSPSVCSASGWRQGWYFYDIFRWRWPWKLWIIPGCIQEYDNRDK